MSIAEKLWFEAMILSDVPNKIRRVALEAEEATNQNTGLKFKHFSDAPLDYLFFMNREFLKEWEASLECIVAFCEDDFISEYFQHLGLKW